jgi:hypothetical protein
MVRLSAAGMGASSGREGGAGVKAFTNVQLERSKKVRAERLLFCKKEAKNF